MQSEPFIIAIFHQKGGVGKTTAVIHLAACHIAKDRHQNTLLIDLDPSESLTSGLGITTSELSIVDMLLGNRQINEVIKPTKYPRLHIIPSHPDLSLASKYLYTRPNFSNILRGALRQKNRESFKKGSDRRVQLRRDFPSNKGMDPQWVLIDCPPMVSPLNIVALTAADLLLIPTQAEAYSIKALDGIFRFIEAVRHQTNPAIDYRIFVNMFDKRSTLQNRLLEKLRSKFDEHLLNTVVGYDANIQYGQLAAEPLFAFSMKCEVAQQFITLAQEIDAYVKSRLPQ